MYRLSRSPRYLFGCQESQKRHNQIKTGMSFLWNLIQHCLSTSRPGTEQDCCVSSISEPFADSARDSTDEASTYNSDSMIKPKGSNVMDSIPLDSDCSVGTTDEVQVKEPGSSISSLPTSGDISGEDGDSNGSVDNSIQHDSEDDLVSNSDLDMMMNVDGDIYLRRGSTEDQGKSRFDQVCLFLASLTSLIWDGIVF